MSINMNACNPDMDDDKLAFPMTSKILQSVSISLLYEIPTKMLDAWHARSTDAPIAPRSGYSLIMSESNM